MDRGYQTVPEEEALFLIGVCLAAAVGADAPVAPAIQANRTSLDGGRQKALRAGLIVSDNIPRRRTSAIS